MSLLHQNIATPFRDVINLPYSEADGGITVELLEQYLSYVNNSFLFHYTKADITGNNEAKKSLVKDLAEFLFTRIVVSQGLSDDAAAALGEGIERLCKSLNEVAEDRSLIPHDFSANLLGFAEKIDVDLNYASAGGMPIIECQQKIIAAARLFSPRTDSVAEQQDTAARRRAENRQHLHQVKVGP